MTLAEIVAESRKAQGLPPIVADEATLARLALLLQNPTPAHTSGKTLCERASKVQLNDST